MKTDIRIEKNVGIFVVGKRDKNGNTAIIPLYKFPKANAILLKYASKDADEFLFDQNYFIEDQVFNISNYTKSTLTLHILIFALSAEYRHLTQIVFFSDEKL